MISIGHSILENIQMITAVALLCGNLVWIQPKLPIEYVDNLIGTCEVASPCVRGPQLPFGSVNPNRQINNGDYDDGCSLNEPIRGLGRLEVSGTRWGTNAQIFLSPQTGVDETEHDYQKSAGRAFLYEYAVTPDWCHFVTKFTPSCHTKPYEPTFPAGDSANLMLDVISENPAQLGTSLNSMVPTNATRQQLQQMNDPTGALLRFSVTDKEVPYWKMAVSGKRIVHSRQWRQEELPFFDDDEFRDHGRSNRNNALKKIEGNGGTESVFRRMNK